MSFNLNDKSFGGGVVIFNNGNAGKVNNVTMTVEKRKATDPDNAPDYKVFFKDEAGALINQGFYYHKDNPMNTEQKNKDNEVYLVSRVLSIAKAVLGKDYVFAEYQTSKEVIDSLFKLINDNCEGKTFDVFVCYGTVTKPSQYLGLRYFNFVEEAGTTPSRLVAGGSDQMTRIVADAPKTDTTTGTQAVW